MVHPPFTAAVEKRPSLGLDDTWFEEAQLRGWRVRVILATVYPGPAGPESLLFGERVAQTDAAISRLVACGRKLLHHHGGVGVNRGERPTALIHRRGCHAA